MSSRPPDIRLLAGSDAYEAMPGLKPLLPFDTAVVGFLDALAKRLLKAPANKAFPDIVTFAFFCRKANLSKLKQPYAGRLDQAVGRGVSFHIAPSNVPINFAYSFVAGLLAGNACIVRVSSKDFAQTAIVAGAIAAVLAEPEHAALREYIAIVGYAHSDEINRFFSSLCDIRVVWGGNATVGEIRQAPLPPRAYDITFADRVSACVIDAAAYLKIADKAQTARDFFNDTYLFDQNACSSPRLIYWVGAPRTVAKAQQAFWDEEHKHLLQRHYALDALTTVDKLTAACRAALDYDGTEIAPAADNLISRIAVKSLPIDLAAHACAGGSYFEYADKTIEPLATLAGRDLQTLTYIGFDAEKLAAFVRRHGCAGIDRIVPCGKAADFGLVWDGYDLMHQMTRTIHTQPEKGPRP